MGVAQNRDTATNAPPIEGSSDAESTYSDFCRVQYPSLLAVITVVTRDRWAAEDIAQEALARAWTHWSRVARMDEPAGWTRHVALNLARSHLRRRRVASFARPFDRPIAADILSEAVADSALMTALSFLTPRQRAAVAWRYLNDLPIHEVASIMRCKEGTVRALTSQGMTRLRKAMAQNLEDDNER